jgi:hypothetical protein
MQSNIPIFLKPKKWGQKNGSRKANVKHWKDLTA